MSTTQMFAVAAKFPAGNGMMGYAFVRGTPSLGQRQPSLDDKGDITLFTLADAQKYAERTDGGVVMKIDERFQAQVTDRGDSFDAKRAISAWKPMGNNN